STATIAAPMAMALLCRRTRRANASNKRPDMRIQLRQLPFALCILLVACGKPEPLTAEKAQQIIRESSYRSEPIYAEVPQKVWWTPKAPKDEYDEKALRTLRNLERAGLVTVTGSETADSGTYIARVTKKGFPILGTA